MVQTATKIKVVVSFSGGLGGQEPQRQPTAQCADNFAMPTSDNKIRPRHIRRRSPWPVFVTQGPLRDYSPCK
jgi:hypothetical protein